MYFLKFYTHREHTGVGDRGRRAIYLILVFIFLLMFQNLGNFSQSFNVSSNLKNYKLITLNKLILLCFCDILCTSCPQNPKAFLAIFQKKFQLPFFFRLQSIYGFFCQLKSTLTLNVLGVNTHF